MNQTTKSALDSTAEFLRRVGAVTKTASDAAGSTPAENQEGGPTEHPSKNVKDTGAVSATEGSQSTANEQAVAESVGPPAVDKAANIFKLAARLAKTAEGNPQEAPMEDGGNLQIGPTKLPTGKDPKNETPGAATVLPDPGSDHPARVDNTAIGQPKYAADMPIEKLAAALTQHGNQLLAAIVNVKAANSTIPAPAQPAAPATIPTALADQGGWELAALANGTMDKKAAEAMVQRDIYELLKAGHEDALLVVEALNGYADGLKQPATKQAASCGGKPKMKPKKAEDDEDDDDDGDYEGGESGGEETVAAPASSEAPPEMAGPPAGGGGGDDTMAQLAAALEALGMTPEELLMALQGGGGDPAAAAAPPAPPGGAGMMAGEAAAAPGPGMEVSAKAAKTKTVKAAVAAPIKTTTPRDKMAAMLQELVSRSRA